MRDEAFEIGGGKLHVLSNPYELDGRVSTHPAGARGFAPANVYLLAEDGEHLLVDTGYSVHEAAVLERLDSLVGADDRLSLLPLRLGEFIGVCNVRPIAERFDVGMIYGVFGMPAPAEWADVRPEYRPSIVEGGGGRLREVEQSPAPAVGESLRLGSEGRELRFLTSPLKLLPTVWLYDTETKTLFSSDCFTWVWRESDEGPWSVTADDDVVTEEEILEYLFLSRFWWLPGADTDPIRTQLAAIFEENEVETIAPCFGCVLSGGEVVARHYRMLDEILRRAPDLPKADVTTGRWNR